MNESRSHCFWDYHAGEDGTEAWHLTTTENMYLHSGSEHNHSQISDKHSITLVQNDLLSGMIKNYLRDCNRTTGHHITALEFFSVRENTTPLLYLEYFKILQESYFSTSQRSRLPDTSPQSQQFIVPWLTASLFCSPNGCKQQAVTGHLHLAEHTV